MKKGKAMPRWLMTKNETTDYGNLKDYPIQDDIWPSRRWNKDKTDYIDLSGEQPQDNKELFTGGEWVKDKNHIVPKETPGIIIASCNLFRAEAEANAALIAQAPAMYKALKDAYELLNAGQPLGNDDLDNIYSILNKANPKQ